MHSGETLLRGCAQDVPEIEWMNKSLGPFMIHLDHEAKMLGAKVYIIFTQIKSTARSN